jgi:hypothetical protein
MVRLSLTAFEEAARQMRTASGVHRMRVMVKARPCNRVIVLKATDDKVSLTTQLRGMNELKILERILGEFVGASMVLAAAAPPEGEGGKKSKKAKKATATTTTAGKKS